MASNITAGAISIIPPDNPVSLTANAPTNAAGGELVYTVPAGVTFYCTGLSMVNVEVAGLVYSIKVDGVTVYETYIQTGGSVTASGQPILAATAGQEIRFYQAATKTCYLNMWGFYI